MACGILVPPAGIDLGAENGNPLQCSCLENPMDRGAWGPEGRKESDMTEILSMHTPGIETRPQAVKAQSPNH